MSIFKSFYPHTKQKVDPYYQQFNSETLLDIPMLGGSLRDTRFIETCAKCCNSPLYYDYLLNNWFCLKCNTITNNFGRFIPSNKKERE